jgi:hypothetical protein
MIDYQAINEQVEREFVCDHTGTRVTCLITSNGNKVFRRQCPRCGRTETVARKALPLAQRLAAVAHDEQLLGAWWARMSARRSQLQEAAESVESEREAAARDAEDQAFWDRYEAHMRSPEWARTRALVLRRAGGKCEGCGIRLPAHIHHRTYEHLGHEMLFELAVVSVPCHRVLHPHRDLVSTLSAC